jgi:PKD repeat protein
VLTEVYLIKVTEMKARNSIRSGFMAILIAADLICSPFAFAGDPSQLLAKVLDQNQDLLTSVMRGRNYVVEVDQQGKIKQIVDTGAIGNGVDPQQTVNGTFAATVSPTTSSVELPESYQGQDAIDYLGEDLPEIAANYGFTPDKLEELLLNDNTIRIDNNSRIFYVDDSIAQQTSFAPDTTEAILTGSAINEPPVPIASPASLANAFKLHSKPGASKTIYLDFDGYTATGTAWSTSSIQAPPFDLGGNTAVFDDNELSNIISIWNRVSEDYIPFDIDVTTEPPSTDALLRTSVADSTYGTRVVITKSGTVSCNCGGIAYVGVVSMINNTFYQPAWVFQQSLANNEKYIAEAASHEAGHTLGLFHDGQTVGTTVNGYYAGHGTGTTGWAPIMGVGYYKNVTQWSSGTYPGANNQQDDIAVFASKGILPRTDTVGNTIASASSLESTNTNPTGIVQTFGVIETSTDVDMYMLNTADGVVNLTVSPATKGPNLDIQLTLYKPDGTVVATIAPETALSANINMTLSAGTYFLAVSGSGHAPTGSDYGYSTYGSLGQYQISGSYPAANNAVPPTAVLGASTVTGPAALTVNFFGSASVGNGSIIGYQWSFGDGTSSTSADPAHTYATVGSFTASLTVTNQYLLTSTKTIPITATAPQPTVHIATATMKLKKTSRVNARVSIKVVNSLGVAIPNAIVTGTWSGAFAGSLSSKTAKNGIALQTSKATHLRKGASGTYTINRISAPGYVYNPTQNAQTVMTIAW